MTVPYEHKPLDSADSGHPGHPHGVLRGRIRAKCGLVVRPLSGLRGLWVCNDTGRVLVRETCPDSEWEQFRTLEFPPLVVCVSEHMD